MTVTSRLIMALVVSLCANAFMGGLLVAPYTPPPAPFCQMSEGMGQMHEGALRRFSGRMPEDVRGMMTEGMRDQREVINGKMNAVKQSRAAVVEALKAEPFDADTLRSALAMQRTAQADVQGTVHEGLIATLKKMTPEQRAKMAENAGKLFR